MAAGSCIDYQEYPGAARRVEGLLGGCSGIQEGLGVSGGCEGCKEGVGAVTRV